MVRLRQWKVRVIRKAEVWVDVLTTTNLQAEIEAAKLPGVIQVFAKSAIPGDEPTNVAPPAGVNEE